MVQSRRAVGLAMSALAGVGCAALLFYFLSISGAERIGDVWAVDRVVAYVLLFAAPLLIFVPLNMILRLGPVWLLGTGSWALLGYVLVFAPAPDPSQADLFTYCAFLALVFAALGSLLAVPAGALSSRLLPPTALTWLRALRQGSLLALFVVCVMAMSPLGVLNWLNVMLVFTIVALTEFFFLARN